MVRQEGATLRLERLNRVRLVPATVRLLDALNARNDDPTRFEELIGSHGGLGGFQTRPFILHPTDWVLDEDVPLGAPSIYRNIRRWLSSIGIELGKQPATAPAAVDAAPPADADEAVAAAT